MAYVGYTSSSSANMSRPLRIFAGCTRRVTHVAKAASMLCHMARSCAIICHGSTLLHCSACFRTAPSQRRLPKKRCPLPRRWRPASVMVRCSPFTLFLHDSSRHAASITHHRSGSRCPHRAKCPAQRGSEKWALRADLWAMVPRTGLGPSMSASSRTSALSRPTPSLER